MNHFSGKPRSYEKNISLGVTDTTGIEFSSTIIAYPKPQYELQYENGTKNTEMMGSVTTNAVYNYTIRYNQTIVNQDDYGTFHLRVHNLYGETTVYVNVIAQSKYCILGHLNHSTATGLRLSSLIILHV